MGVSIDDVARRAQVSTATVSRALRGLPRVSAVTRARVIAAADALGYVASPSASGLASGRTRTVGVLVPFVDRWYFGQVIEGVDQMLRDNGYNLLLFSLGGYRHGAQRSFTESMVRRQIDALVVLARGLSPEELRQLRHTDIPLISVGGPVPGCHGVYIDDFAAATLAVEHLIARGHRHIAHIRAGDHDQERFNIPALRTQAFEAAMQAAGLTIRPQWLVGGDYTVSGGARAAAQIFDAAGGAPTAVFCGSDELALGVIFEALRRGISIPAELSVIGIDDHDFAASAGLTTVAQRPWEQGRAAGRMVLESLGGNEDALRDLAMPFELIERHSTAAPPA